MVRLNGDKGFIRVYKGTEEGSEHSVIYIHIKAINYNVSAY